MRYFTLIGFGGILQTCPGIFSDVNTNPVGKIRYSNLIFNFIYIEVLNKISSLLKVFYPETLYRLTSTTSYHSSAIITLLTIYQPECTNGESKDFSSR
jgi:hypothetical protein